MEHVDYMGWVDYLSELIQVHDIPMDQVLELAAGTGSFSQAGLFAQSSLCIHVDNSLSMLSQMKKKSPRICASGTDLPLRGGFDSIWMMYDSFNYFLTSEQALQNFKEVSRLLKPGGYFIFDTTTKRNSKMYFTDFVDFLETPQCSIIRKSWYEEEESKQYNRFIFFEQEGDSFSKKEELHCQRIYNPSQIKSWISQVGLQLVACYHNETLEPAKTSSERLHFVVRKESNS